MKGGIRGQLTVYLVLFAAALGALSSGVTLWVYHRVEDRAINRRLAELLATYDADVGAESDRAPNSSLAGPWLFVGPSEQVLSQLPAAYSGRLRAIGPGYYEWEEPGREIHALVAQDPGSGERRLAIASFHESSNAERSLEIALAFGVLVTSLSALLMARSLAARIVSPIVRLTEQVAKADLVHLSQQELVVDSSHHEVRVLAQTLGEAGARVRASAERERRFLREASHELRTPITVIQGVYDLMLEDSRSPSRSLQDSKRDEDRLERLGRSVRRMEQSVSSLLAMARVEHRLLSKDDSSPPSFERRTMDAIEEARSLANPGVVFSSTINDAPNSLLEQAMMVVVLSNLLRNSAQNTTTGHVQLSIENGEASIEDTGEGISSSIIDQLHAEGPRPDVGLGLATVHRICQRFGWSLDLARGPSGGTYAHVSWKSSDRGKQ